MAANGRYRERRVRRGRAIPQRRVEGSWKRDETRPAPAAAARSTRTAASKTLKPDRDSEWQRLGEAYGRLDERLRGFAERALGRAGMEAAYGEFLLWPDEAPDAAFLERQGQLFCSWSIFNWFYEPGDVDGPLRLPPG